MEDALRWGVDHIFSRHLDPTEQPPGPNTDPWDSPFSPPPAFASSPSGDVKMEEAPSPPHSPSPMQEATAHPPADPHSSPELALKSPFGAPDQQHHQHRSRNKASPGKPGGAGFQPPYTDSMVDSLLQWSASLPGRHGQVEPSTAPTAAAAAAVPDQTDPGGDDGVTRQGVQSLGAVLGPGWGCVKVHEWSQAQMDDESNGDEGEPCTCHCHSPRVLEAPGVLDQIEQLIQSFWSCKTCLGWYASSRVSSTYINQELGPQRLHNDCRTLVDTGGPGRLPVHSLLRRSSSQGVAPKDLLTCHMRVLHHTTQVLCHVL